MGASGFVRGGSHLCTHLSFQVSREQASTPAAVSAAEGVPKPVLSLPVWSSSSGCPVGATVALLPAEPSASQAVTKPFPGPGKAPQAEETCFCLSPPCLLSHSFRTEAAAPPSSAFCFLFLSKTRAGKDFSSWTRHCAGDRGAAVRTRAPPRCFLPLFCFTY